MAREKQDKITASALRARKAPSPAAPRRAAAVADKPAAYELARNKIVAITAYDASFARLLDAAGVDVLLVGDSLGMVVQGLPNTLAVTIEDIIYHTRAVVRGSERSLVVADLPFMSYQISAEQALGSAGRVVKEGGAEAVKLEGGLAICPAVARIVDAGIPVMGHLGLTPQSLHALGGFRVQGRDEATRERLLADARGLEQAGVFSIVLEAVPRGVAKWISESVSVPTIGIGAGPDCDGQVLVCYDLLGLFQGFVPRFVKRYADLGESVVAAAKSYLDEVRAGQFPDDAHSFADARRVEPELPDEARYASAPKGRE